MIPCLSLFMGMDPLRYCMNKDACEANINELKSLRLLQMYSKLVILLLKHCILDWEKYVFSFRSITWVTTSPTHGRLKLDAQCVMRNSTNSHLLRFVHRPSLFITNIVSVSNRTNRPFLSCDLGMWFCLLFNRRVSTHWWWLESSFSSPPHLSQCSLNAYWSSSIRKVGSDCSFTTRYRDIFNFLLALTCLNAYFFQVVASK